ncbi:hypothetical protein Fcan01_11186 [Folsomia candida]|uniref:Uncharacterized protein n=1 Tax=Folsomia candida TaxID=158441 RepID=A0A226E8Q1_FOLCA|nr:hypothetical protein Fcan01_11186 [Folsomia candida]
MLLVFYVVTIWFLTTSYVQSLDVHFYTKQFSFHRTVLDFIQSHNTPKFYSKVVISWEIYTNSTQPVPPPQRRFASYFYAINIFPGSDNSSSSAYYDKFYQPFEPTLLSPHSFLFLHLDYPRYWPFKNLRGEIYLVLRGRIFQFVVNGESNILRGLPPQLQLVTLPLRLNKYLAPFYERITYVNNPRSVCWESLNAWRRDVPPCKAPDSIINVQASVFNLTIVQSNENHWDYEIIYAVLASPGKYVGHLVEFKDIQDSISYCKKYVPTTNWTVWFIPFGKFVWILVATAVWIVAFTSWIAFGVQDEKFWIWKTLVFQIFFQVSMFMRQPIRNCNRTNVTLGFASLILLSLYETFLTGLLIAPSPPEKYRHIGDLVEAGIKCFIDRLNPNFIKIETMGDSERIRESWSTS